MEAEPWWWEWKCFYADKTEENTRFYLGVSKIESNRNRRFGSIFKKIDFGSVWNFTNRIHLQFGLVFE